MIRQFLYKEVHDAHKNRGVVFDLQESESFGFVAFIIWDSTLDKDGKTVYDLTRKDNNISLHQITEKEKEWQISNKPLANLSKTEYNERTNKNTGVFKYEKRKN